MVGRETKVPCACTCHTLPYIPSSHTPSHTPFAHTLPAHAVFRTRSSLTVAILKRGLEISGILSDDASLSLSLSLAKPLLSLSGD
mmetsp:Transcript_30450/g.65868  ORF Transcript_30450/g.65868 Transcript_30450/m.65868 type:complete len:85 (-) Transcript_30450:83-337(-)